MLTLNAALARRSVISIVAIPIARSMEQLYRNNAKRKELHQQAFHPPSSARRRRKASYSTPPRVTQATFSAILGAAEIEMTAVLLVHVRTQLLECRCETAHCYRR